MSKATVVLISSILLAVAVVAVVQLRNPPSIVQTEEAAHDEFDKILDAVAFVPIFPRGYETDEEKAAIKNTNLLGRKKEKDAIEKLRHMGTNAFPRLMVEVRSVGRMKATNHADARTEGIRIVAAFRALGSVAKPLLPELTEEFYSGRSVGSSAVAIAGIGGTDAGLALVPGLTNSDPYIRNSALTIISEFSTNRQVALAAVGPMLTSLRDNSPYSRALASSILGTLGVKQDVVIPALLIVAENDPDNGVRCIAIRSLGGLGTNAVLVKSNLEVIATKDREESVRRIAAVAVRAIDGKIAPEDVH